MANNTPEEIMATYNQPPKNLEAERNFIGSLLLDGTLIEKVNESLGTLLPKEFFNKQNQIIYGEILERASTTEDFNVTVVCAELERKGKLSDAGGLAYVAGLTELLNFLLNLDLNIENRQNESAGLIRNTLV